MEVRSYKDLKVWQESINLVKDIYSITIQFPKEEMYGLVLQIRRSAISIPSNIAEGFSRQHKTEKVQFLYIAIGSSAELNTQLIIAKDLNYITEQNYKIIEGKLEHIGRMIQNLIRSLKKYERTPNL